MLTMVLQGLTEVGASGLITFLAANHVEEVCSTGRGLVPIRRKCICKSFCATYNHGQSSWDTHPNSAQNCKFINSRWVHALQVTGTAEAILKC